MAISEITELEFVAEVKSWVDEICQRKGEDFPFKRAAVEKRPAGKLKRNDFILRDHRDRIVLTGEFKLPDRPDGRNPYAESLVLDAHNKANSEGVEYFFTSNFNRTVVWQTFRPNTPIADRYLEFFDWLSIRTAEDLARPEIQDRLKASLDAFLEYCAELVRGARQLPRHPLDKRFIHALESALEGPSALTRTAIVRKAGEDRKFRDRVGRWAAANLGGVYDPREPEPSLDIAARFSSYILAIKIVFYDALRRKHPSLSPLRIPKNGLPAAKLREKLDRAFRNAEKVSGDYETVFEGDEFGDSLPFLADEVAPAWRDLVEQVDHYDFTGIDYDIIGQIFERLISPQERHKFGQHYTKSEIVDVINAFAIRDPGAVVLDPACGGGTFLVRAYARKRWLAEATGAKQSHEDRLSQIYGADISSYAAHLAVVSLASRDLGRVENYPRVAQTDFFKVTSRKKLFPVRVERTGKTSEIIKSALERVDAVVGNPPYVRQEELSQDQKQDYANASKDKWMDLRLSGRSDLHLYFWPHAASFLLDEGGHFGFLTSSSWLDVEYGFELQKWILSNFCIEAIIESSVEPWFTDARVGTAVTILRREKDLKSRQANLVRFVQVRRPLADILIDAQHGDDRIGAAEEIRRRILETRKSTETKDWRIRVVKQSDLIEADDKSNPANHTGGKWGIHLRAPDIFFELMDRFGDKFVPLRELAEIRFGLKTGCDAFFFPRDITDEVVERMSDSEFKKTYGITRRETKKVRVCKAGDGSVHLIEAEYLEPEVHSLMEIDSITIKPENLKRRVLLVSEPKSALRGKHVAKYLRYGETHAMGRGEGNLPVPKKVSVASRASESRFWYDLTGSRPGMLFWPKAQQYRHIVPLNAAGFICSNNLYDVYPLHDIPPAVLAAVLNSSIVALAKFQYGRGVGREANLKTEVVDLNMMPVPDPRKFSKRAQEALLGSFGSISRRISGDLISEFGEVDRQTMDEAILQGLGAERSESDEFRARVYDQMTRHLTQARDLELIAQKNRLASGRNGEDSIRQVSRSEWQVNGDDSTDTLDSDTD